MRSGFVPIKRPAQSNCGVPTRLAMHSIDRLKVSVSLCGTREPTLRMEVLP